MEQLLAIETFPGERGLPVREWELNTTNEKATSEKGRQSVPCRTLVC